MVAPLMLWLAGTAGVQAHQSSDSFLQINVADSTLIGHWQIALRDLDQVLALDTDVDGQLTWGEIRNNNERITALARAGLLIGSTTSIKPARQAIPCALDWLPITTLDRHSDGTYAVLNFTGRCSNAIGSLQIHYTLFADTDSGHRGLLNLKLGDAMATGVLGPDHATAVFAGGMHSAWRGFAQYLYTGVEHIFGGYDHILFLLSLLLPAVLIRRSGSWDPQHSLRAALIEVSKVVTAFTVAHSITLGLAVFDVVRLPARWSESAIALSVIIAALNNVFPLIHSRRWAVAFGFGLIHGFGFANVLKDLALPAQELSLALVGFNFGVELGQLLIVAAFLPLAFVFRATFFYRRTLLAGGSCAIALIAGLWLVERAFNFSLDIG
jgi:hypothetical protein